MSRPMGHELGTWTLEERNGGTRDTRKWTASLYSDQAANFIFSQEHYTAKGQEVGRLLCNCSNWNVRSEDIPS